MSAGDNADTEFRPDIQDRAFVGDGFKHVAHVVEAQTVFRHDVPKAALVVGLPRSQRSLEVGKILPPDVDRLVFVLDQDIDDAVRNLNGHRPDFLGRIDAEAAAFDHRGAAHAERRAFGRNDHVAACYKRGIACEGAPVDDSDQWHEPAQPRKSGEGGRVNRDTRADIVLARTAAAALAEQYDRQAEAVRQLEHPVLLVVISMSLRAGEHRVVIMGSGAICRPLYHTVPR
jgi:hypothetical protein